jgi:hypothetical protein
MVRPAMCAIVWALCPVLIFDAVAAQAESAGVASSPGSRSSRPAAAGRATPGATSSRASSSIFTCTLQEAPPSATEPAKPASHTTRVIDGWTVHIDDRLLSGPDRALGDRALHILDARLFEITLVVPADKVKWLQRVPLQLDRTHGKLKSMQYHPSAEWLKENGYDVALAKCVHIPDAAYFASYAIQFQQPWAVLHELSHAYHDQVLGFDNAEIKDAWRKFCDSGKYKSVPHMNGHMRPHYGLTNQMEFFAEMTEAYFGMNDFYPFNRAELQRAEPELTALLTEIWEGNGGPPRE